MADKPPNKKRKHDEDLKRMYEEEVFSDFTIQTKSRSFSVHKAVLAARSPVLFAMLTGGMKEAHGVPMHVPDVSDETMHMFLLFLYTDSFDKDLQWKEAARLYSVADKYQVLTLRERCSLLLKSSVTVENACHILILANLHLDDEDLNSAVKKYISRHVKEVVGSGKWRKFELENVTLANEILRAICLKNFDSKRETIPGLEVIGSSPSTANLQSEPQETVEVEGQEAGNETRSSEVRNPTRNVVRKKPKKKTVNCFHKPKPKRKKRLTFTSAAEDDDDDDDDYFYFSFPDAGL